MTASPVWSEHGSRAWLLCDIDRFTRTVLGWSRDERRWYAWRAPLRELPSASSYVFPSGWREPASYSGGWLQVAAGADVFLWTSLEGAGVVSAYHIVLPGNWAMAGEPEPLSFVAPGAVPIAVSPTLDRAAYVAWNREHQKTLVERVPWNGTHAEPERHRVVALPPDTPEGQEVALGPTSEAFLVAGSSGHWRVLRADLHKRAVEDLVTLAEP
jgi:hypothetical protein